MKKLLFLIMFLPSLSLGSQGISQPPVFNPFTGKLDYIGPGNGLPPGQIYYLYRDTSAGTSAYYTFDGTNFCLFVNAVSQFCYSQPLTSAFLLLEDGSFLLLEDGTKLILQ